MTQREPDRADRLPIRRLVISVVMVMVSTLPVFLSGAAILQLEADIGLTPTGLGAITGAFFLTASIASAPLGRLVERVGWRKAMKINALVSATTALAIAAFVNSPLTLGALLVVSGVSYGVTNPAANYALAKGSSARRRGLVFGLKHAGIPASTLVSGAAVPILVLTIGWRPTFTLSAFFAVLAWLLIRAEPIKTETDRPDEGVKKRIPLTTGQLVTIAVGSACATWAAVGLGTFGVAGGVDAGLTESEAGLLLFAGSAASILARLVAGALADRRRSQGFVGVSAMMAIGAVAFVILDGVVGATFAAVVVVAFAFGWGWPGLMTFSVVNANTGTAAASSGITQAGIFFGAGVSPLALGWIIEQWEFDVAWIAVAIFLALASLVVGTVAFQRRGSTADAV